MAMHTPVETPDGRILVSRHYAAWALRRHPNVIRRHGVPVACTGSRVVLYDLAELETVLGDTPRRCLTRTAS